MTLFNKHSRVTPPLLQTQETDRQKNVSVPI